ncbi:MAG TPA: hypothetical protein PLX06_04270 [Fimbriimonadaceae bacterium]|nr:hypothetical protein [Fimbriimonadaceae bacterium]
MGLGTLAFVGLGLALTQGPIGLQLGGRTVQLGETLPVAVGVKDVSWEPNGRALMYDAVDVDGYVQGLFRTSDGKGKMVLRHSAGTQFHDWKWLPKKLAVVEIVSREVAGTGKKRWSVYLLDAQNLTAREMLGLEYPKDEEMSLDFELSPTRDHGLLTVRDAKGERTYVLLDNGTSLVLSADVTQAKSQGAAFAGWSADGTAYFSAAGSTHSSTILDKAIVNEGGQVSIQLMIGDKMRSRGFEVLGDLPLLGRLFLRAKPIAPELGIPVLEVMPWNGGLRPVRSRGPFEETSFSPPAYEPKPEAALVTATGLRGEANSLWLVPELIEEGRPRPQGGLLVAAEAGQSWMPTIRNWIAYETAGALFVRAITLKN